MISDEEVKFVLLAILDGWGIAPDSPGNAITQANTPNMDKIMSNYPHGQLSASGLSVGLPEGEDGNTETGHLNLGAGRIVYQDVERINMAIEDGSFFRNEVINGAFLHAQKNKSKLHIMGLIGAGRVHSSLEHLFALLKFAHQKNFKEVYLHLFTDGRDSPSNAAKTYLSMVDEVIKREGVGKIASIMGRYWSMDRDQRWDRTKRAYEALTQGKGNIVKSAQDAIDLSYKTAITDEFIEPSLIVDEQGKFVGLIEDGDAVIFYNFRIDRPRQLTKAFLFKDFSKVPVSYEYDPYLVKYEKTHIRIPEAQAREPFKREKVLKNLFFVTMTDYGKPIADAGAKIAFPPEVIDIPLSGVLSSNGLRQLKITESEKERFVTFYLNGLREKPYPLEEVVIIPSAKVATYDLKPEMNAHQITETLLKRLEVGEYKLLVVNYPNPDMVGHTGNIGACVRAIEVVDECIGRLASYVTAYGGVLIVTADHGNAEEMINLETGQIDTEHSTNKVPFTAVSSQFLGKSITTRSGILADVAPTILKLLKLPIPSSMTGRDLLVDIK